MKRLSIPILISAILSAAFFSAIVTASGTGSAPHEALQINGQWQTLAPRSSLWFYFDYAGDRSKIEVTVDNYDAKYFELAIYTPEQSRDWYRDQAVPPIGRGAKPPEGRAYSGRDLYWSGAFNFGGRFFAVVTNQSSYPVEFRLWISGTGITLYPMPTPTSLFPYLDNPFATPIPRAVIPGKLVFQDSSGGIIYTVNGDGSNLRRITYGLDPSWSPDGKQIAFTRWNEPPGLYVVNADGSSETRVADGPQFLSPRWNPDGRRIVYSHPRGGSAGTVACIGRFCFPVTAEPRWQLRVVELNKVIDDQTNLNVFTDPPCTRGCFAPSWHPDGRSIIYTDGAIGILSTETMTNSIWTMFNQHRKVQSSGYSPDGNKVAFQIAQHDHWEIAVLDLVEGKFSQLTWGDPLSFRRVNNVSPVWSPDGAQILFLSDRRGKWEFFVMNVDGTNIRQVLASVTDSVFIHYNYSNERMVDWVR